MDTYSIKLSGIEVGRVSGEGIKPGQKLDGPAYAGKLVEDTRMLSLKVDGRTVFVLYVSGRDDVSVEKVSGDGVSNGSARGGSALGGAAEGQFDSGSPTKLVDVLADAAAELARPINEKIAEEIERSAANGLPPLRYPGKL